MTLTEAHFIGHREDRTIMPQTTLQQGRHARAIFATIVVLSASLSQIARSEEALSPAAQRGLVFVRAHCAKCHSVDRVGPSPLAVAPPFRRLHERYPVETSKSRSPKASSPAIRRCRSSSSIPGKSAT